MTNPAMARRLMSSGAIILMLGGPSQALAKAKARHAQAPHHPACERAAYPGDPVCDLHEKDPVEKKATLPIPASRNIRRAEEASGLPVGERVSVDGKTNFNENRFGEAPLHKLTPGPRKKDVNGGAQIDYKF